MRKGRGISMPKERPSDSAAAKGPSPPAGTPSGPRSDVAVLEPAEMA